ncbi:MAG: twin-arginine translocase subunit TatC [Elusimicrobiota bacterium]
MKDKQTLIEHLEELRLRILYAAGAAVIFAVLSFFFNREILDFIRIPLGRELVFIAPQEAFLVTLKVSFFAGIIISMPIIAYNLWKFIGIALEKNEKKFILIYMPATLLLFAVGAFFGFFVILPLGLGFLLDFGGPGLKPMLSVDKYVGFVFLMVMVFGITFQLPLIMRMVTSLGIVEKTALRSGRRYAVVIIFLVAAMLTPPDVFTQVALALPVLILYEIGLMVSSGKTSRDKIKG